MEDNQEGTVVEPTGTESPEAGGFPKAATKPTAKPRPSRAKAPAASDGVEDSEQATGRGGELLIDITLHDSTEIPPNGQFIGVDGRQYILKPGVRTSVPVGVVDVLDNAVHSVPEMDDRMRVIGWRSAPRLTYTLHRD